MALYLYNIRHSVSYSKSIVKACILLCIIKVASTARHLQALSTLLGDPPLICVNKRRLCQSSDHAVVLIVVVF